MTKAFAYLRVSGKAQIEGDGFKRQTLAVQNYAKQHALRIVQVFREEGVSGTKNLEDRPAFLEMLTALHSDGVKLVLVERLDRLARDLMIQETIIGDLRRNGFELISVEEPDLLQDDPSRILMRQFMGAISQYEKTMIVRKLRGARQRKKAETGRCEGRKRYGVRAGESEVISRMRELRAQKFSFDRIAATLNEGGVKTRTPGKRWHGFAVNQILAR